MEWNGMDWYGMEWIGMVWNAIMERKRSRDEDGAQTQAAGAQAKQPRQDRSTKITIANAQDAIAERSRKRELDKPETEKEERSVKQCKGGK